MCAPCGWLDFNHLFSLWLVSSPSSRKTVVGVGPGSHNAGDRNLKRGGRSRQCRGPQDSDAGSGANKSGRLSHEDVLPGTPCGAGRPGALLPRAVQDLGAGAGDTLSLLSEGPAAGRGGHLRRRIRNWGQRPLSLLLLPVGDSPDLNDFLHCSR